MTERDALLAAVCAHPDDDTPRLVFADHLDDAGEVERAEFIREQAGGQVLGLNRTPLPIGSDMAWVGYPLKLAWIKHSLPDLTEGSRLRFARGFVDSVTCTAADWLAHADAILAAHPVREVTLTTAPWIEPVRGGLYARLLGRAKELACGVGRQGVQLVEDLLRAEWPSVRTWTLPDPVGGTPVPARLDFDAIRR